jgi:acyl dehydratase
MSASVELKEGASLPAIKKNILQDNIDRYARASGDFNPIHIDAEYARQTPLGGTVAHGMLVLAYISQMMATAFGHDWVSGGKLNVRFRTPARPGDVITVSGTIRHVEKGDGLQTVDCDVLCSNQKDEPVITGDARVKVGEQ